MLRLYDFHESGNGYKVRLLLAQLGLDYAWTDLDIMHGASRTPEFLRLNPNGRIPLLLLEDGRTLAESNAILFHLARDTALLPEDPFEQARVLQWMFFEQYSHEPYIAVLRHWHFAGTLDDHRHELEDRRARGEAALDVMETHLEEHAFFVGGRYSIADIALYAYTHVAEEGGFDLSSRSILRAWLERVAAQSGHVSITELPPRQAT
ncbi:MAG: glutathione S-transferase family protein [Deltaproteobacteria bacterium]|jgi:glutathione S-transferase|nr:glutathione S-transferase family protein [Deltaproteobacteria bacterium]MBW2497878.1 glutathione S-transferase family protein [Deltaproteobacteria bacterium]